MAFPTSKWFFGILAGAVVLGLFPLAARGQYLSQVRQVTSQPRNNTATSVRVNARPAGYVAPRAYPGYAPGYGPISYPDPYGGYLSGASDVINAQGNFMVKNQEAMQMKEDVKQAKVDTRRKTFDNWMYERDMTPTLEDNRERARMEEYRRSRNDPPLNEIWSGKALNDLLNTIQKTPGQGPAIPLDPDLVRHINVTSGAGHSGMGLLKDTNKLPWPVTLQGSAYDTERKKFEQLLPMAVQQAQQGPAPGETINGLTSSIDKLTAQLKRNISNIDANDYIKSKRFLNELTESCKVLQQSNAGKYVTGQLSAQGNTVGELLYNLTRQGLFFGPATAGDQEAYTALHRAMVVYDQGIHQLVTQK